MDLGKMIINYTMSH